MAARKSRHFRGRRGETLADNPWEMPGFDAKMGEPFRKRVDLPLARNTDPSRRVPGDIMGPFKSKKELHEYSLFAAPPHAFASLGIDQQNVGDVQKIFDIPDCIVFTEGDLAVHSILMGRKILSFLAPELGVCWMAS